MAQETQTTSIPVSQLQHSNRTQWWIPHGALPAAPQEQRPLHLQQGPRIWILKSVGRQWVWLSFSSALWFSTSAQFPKPCFNSRSEAGGIHASLFGGAAGPLALAGADRALWGDRVSCHGRCSPNGEKTTPPAACGDVESCPPWKSSASLGQRWRQRELSNSHLKALHCHKTEH